MIKINESRYIDESIEDILKQIRQETSDRGDMYLKDITKRGNNFVVTCPFHGDHKEKKPACTVFGTDYNNFKEGDYHCFVCDAHGSFNKFVAGCFEQTEDYGKSWLLERYGNTFVEKELYLPTIDLNKYTDRSEEYLNESVLDAFEPYHPYMEKRKLSLDVCKKFKVKYDPQTSSLVFPVWDERGNLYMLTRRSVKDKTFIIDADKEKPVYLMNFVKENDIPYVIVVESQINALTCMSYGLSSVATFGVNLTPKQFGIFNRSNVRNYILAFDGDEAGSRAVQKFMKNIRKDVFVSVLHLPPGKDINDLDKEEFINLMNSEGLNYDMLKNKYEERMIK
jgi:DNA primase